MTSIRRFSSLPLRRIALWALALNALWEFAQCGVFYQMWDDGLLSGGLLMMAAIAGDVVIVMGVAFLAFQLTGAAALNKPTVIGWGVLAGVGFLVGVVLEWISQVLRLWGYNPWMPTIPVLGYEVGLLPVLQITVLPAISVYSSTCSRKLHPSRSDVLKDGQQL